MKSLEVLPARTYLVHGSKGSGKTTVGLHFLAAGLERSEAGLSGVTEIDEMLHGRLERGKTSLITGPTGVGKTTLGMVFMKEAAERGKRSVIFSFEESKGTLLERAAAVNIPIQEMLDDRKLSQRMVEPLRYSSRMSWRGWYVRRWRETTRKS